MTQQEYDRYRKIANKVCKGDERTDDLFHDVLIQLKSNVKYSGLSIQEKTYFFTRAISNQFNSNNSQFYRQYRRQVKLEPEEPIEEEYKEKPTIEWVEETLTQEVEENPAYWYEAGIFRLYIQHKKLEKVHRQTQIPKYSLRETINQVKKLLKDKWEKLN